MKTKPILELNHQGELLDPGLVDDIRRKYTPDTPFLKGLVPYLVMVLCCFIDGCFFYSLFSLISYDRPLLLWVQIGAFLFGADCIPIFIGVHFKKLQQGLIRNTSTLLMAIAACALVFTVNIGLRAATVDLMSPDLSGSEDSYFTQTDSETPETTEEAEPPQDPVAWMVAITGMVLPLVTSIGSFYISYHCYDPLLIKKQREEEMIRRREDKIRRLEAMIDACTADEDIEQQMLEDDDKRYAAARNQMAGLMLEYYDYVRRRLMEQLQDPAATSLLSAPADGEVLLDTLNRLSANLEDTTLFPAIPADAGQF